MSIKGEQASSPVQTTVTSTTSATSTTGPKISMFAKKAGFVIPKNKLSGSLVPIFRGGKKDASNCMAEENSKDMQRKTKWGTDLTQDTAVRKGRAVAYQTRVDQITQQLKSGILGTDDDEDLLPPSGVQDHEASGHQQNNKRKLALELERRETIGEILKLNPSYRPPTDYKPLLKEEKVPIPIKEYPGYNFISLIFGQANDTQKRLEKETGAKIRVYGAKSASGQKVEITSSDGSEKHGAYEELYVHVSADTYDKVDAAVALIELLVTPVSVKSASVSTQSMVSGNVTSAVIPNQETQSPFAPSPRVNQGAGHFTVESAADSSQGSFQQFQGPWFPIVSQAPLAPIYMGSAIPSAPLVGSSNQVSSSSFNLSNVPSLFGPRPTMATGYSSMTPDVSVVSSRPQLPQVLPGPHLPQALPVALPGTPRNPSMPNLPSAPAQFNTASQNPFSGNHPTSTGYPQNSNPTMPFFPQSVPAATFSERPPASSLGSTGWTQSHPRALSSLGPKDMTPMPPPIVSHQGHHHVGSHPLAVSGSPMINGPPSNSIPPLPQPSASQLARADYSYLSAATPFNPVSQPQFGPSPVTAPRPQLVNSSDFTFQPHRPPNPAFQVVHRPGGQSAPQHVTHISPPNQMMHPPRTPQNPTVQLPPHNSSLQGFPRPAVGNQMNQTRALVPVNMDGNPMAMPIHLRRPALPNPTGISPAAVPQMPARNFGFPPMSGNNMQHQYSHLPNQPQRFDAPNQPFRNVGPFGPGMPPVGATPRPQSYDPFSPTSAVHLRGNARNMQRLDSDPEYEDLMASVGVK